MQDTSGYVLYRNPPNLYRTPPRTHGGTKTGPRGNRELWDTTLAPAQGVNSLTNRDLTESVAPPPAPAVLREGSGVRVTI
jgi:hypothetical protein